MERQTDNQLIQRIEPEIGALAAQGYRSWDPAQININLLATVPLVQGRLAELDAAARADPDAKLKTIGSSWKRPSRLSLAVIGTRRWSSSALPARVLASREPVKNGPQKSWGRATAGIEALPEHISG